MHGRDAGRSVAKKRGLQMRRTSKLAGLAAGMGGNALYIVRHRQGRILFEGILRLSAGNVSIALGSYKG
jgi:hypothetical protein